MIVNPKIVLESGYVTKFDGCLDINIEEQCQQVGIDVRVDLIARVAGPVQMSDADDEKIRPTYFPLVLDKFGFFHLQANYAYVVDTMEYIQVPNNMTAFLIHRSSYNRSGILCVSAVFDPGFRGRIGCTMYPSVDVSIKWGSRLGQIVFMEADAASLYVGQYQDQK